MDLLEAILNTSLRLMVPLLLAALGELIAERAGVLNIGLEGMITAGAFSAYAAVMLGWGWPAAIIAALVIGAAVAAVMAIGAVWMGGNQILVGFALFILVPGIANFLYVQIGWTDGSPALNTFAVPLLSEIPVFGPALFEQTVFFYLAALLAAAVWFLFARTRAGVVVTATGHSPVSVNNRGSSSRRVRTYALLACGALAGIAGAAMSLGSVGSYVPNIVGGRGLIVIAIVILGRWTVPGAVAGALLIAVLDSLQLNLAEQSGIPLQLFSTLPWLVVIAMLVVSARLRSNVPRTLAQ
ncbi:ABC transporter permease [Nocardioides daejeonensis]|uniref:ABC transporter permease n=1 Tax=Nocardioides daejeonensis TaxID=1046556 RepID=UPI000D74C8D9|nr:ABC transporter permease [Nocardioides daejeonensis]